MTEASFGKIRDRFPSFVQNESDAAVRELASSYLYDHNDQNTVTLRDNNDWSNGPLRHPS